MRIIAVANQKGGCGKTTTAINLSASLAFLQKKVLLIDLDPQGHSTCGLNVRAEFLEKTTYDLFQEHSGPLSDLIVSVNSFLWLIPTHVILSKVEQELAAQGTDAYQCLKKRLWECEEAYDYVVIDSPPNLGVLTYNALTAAEEVIVPVEPSFFSLHGLAKIFETLHNLKQEQNRTLQIHALITRFEKRTKLAREIKEEVYKHFKDQMFVTTIDENIRLKEAAASGQSIVDFDRESLGFKNYVALAIEIIERGLIWQGEIKRVPAVSEEPPVQNLSTEEIPNPSGSSGKHEESPTQSSAPEAQTTLQNSEPVDLEALKPQKVLGGVLFSYLSATASSIMVAGDFNRWIAEPMVLVDRDRGLWQKVIPIEPGTHHYKFLVNDSWKTDPFNPVTESNRYGGTDSVISLEDAPFAYGNREEAKTGTF